MPDITTVAVWTFSAFLMALMVRALIKHVEDAQAGAARSHVLAVLERERCQRILADCQQLRSDCHVAAAAAHDAMDAAEDFAESVEPFGDDDGDDDDDY